MHINITIYVFLHANIYKTPHALYTMHFLFFIFILLYELIWYINLEIVYLYRKPTT